MSEQKLDLSKITGREGPLPTNAELADDLRVEVRRLREERDAVQREMLADEFMIGSLKCRRLSLDIGETDNRVTYLNGKLKAAEAKITELEASKAELVEAATIAAQDLERGAGFVLDRRLDHVPKDLRAAIKKAGGGK